MTSRRILKAAAAIREVVSMTILTEIKDPRVENVTVTFVEVSPDMRIAKVHVSVMGNEAKQSLAMHGLRNSAGFLQAKIAKRIDTRYTPRIQFVLDQGVKHSIEVSRMLKELLPAPAPDSPEPLDTIAAPDSTHNDGPAAG
jgi:ribosome-binding factor A